ncbi:MAG: hypothetical protein AAF721_12250, partial [Myxococcota bacterium]
MGGNDRRTLAAVLLLAGCATPSDDDSLPPAAADTTRGDDGIGTTSVADPADATNDGESTGEAADSDSGSGSPSDDSTDGGPATVERAFDLDGDGIPDTDLAVGVCPDDAAATCLLVTSEVTPTQTVVLWGGTPTCLGGLHGSPLAVLGDFAGSALFEVSVAACQQTARAVAPPVLAVVDVDAATILGSATAPANQIYGWVETVGAPDGRRHPVLAPSYSDGENPSGNWGRLCAYRPDLPSSPECGDGFVAMDVPLALPYFREVGGTVQDLDGDGWQDLNFIFHRTVASASIGTLGALGSVTFDVAAADEPGSPAWFHSGRNYGSHAAFTGSDGSERLLLVGGAPIGTFADDLCNVSRFVALLQAPAGNPAGRALAWSRYFGFSSTTFSTFAPQYVADPSQDVARLADVVDGCIHRFSDSRSQMDGEDVVVIDYFAMTAPIDYCLDEQYALYQEPTWTDEKADAWYTCFG